MEFALIGSERLGELLRTKLRFAAKLPHIWWGVSVENRRHGLPRIQHLVDGQPAVAFLSIEPLLEDLGPVKLQQIDWVIVDGESGVGARPLQREWVVSLRNQCDSAAVRFFFKQWGGVKKSVAGRELDGRIYDDLPSFERGLAVSASDRKALIAHFSGTASANLQTRKRLPA